MRTSLLLIAIAFLMCAVQSAHAGANVCGNPTTSWKYAECNGGKQTQPVTVQPSQPVEVVQPAPAPETFQVNPCRLCDSDYGYGDDRLACKQYYNCPKATILNTCTNSFAPTYAADCLSDNGASQARVCSSCMNLQGNPRQICLKKYGCFN